MSSESITLDLALQGNRAHGAFTWGVLDQLLEEPRIHYAAFMAPALLPLLLELCNQGQRAADPWLVRHWSNLGQRSTLELGSIP